MTQFLVYLTGGRSLTEPRKSLSSDPVDELSLGEWGEWTTETLLRDESRYTRTPAGREFIRISNTMIPVDQIKMVSWKAWDTDDAPIVKAARNWLEPRRPVPPRSR